MAFNLLEYLKGYKVKGIAVGFIVLTLVDKFLLDINGFQAGENWIMEIMLASGVFAARDTVTSVTGK
jgi:hypothetical protein